jgi:DNA-binding response OmpR family regulator
MKSILLVDDEEIICAAFKRTLQDFGFEVETAHTVEAALDSTENAQFDAILLEFNLRSDLIAHPRTGNGLEVLRRLRTSHITTPVLMFTAMEGEPYETASLDAGADEFIPKTTSVPSLVARLRANIRRKAGIRASAQPKFRAARYLGRAK